ncbi:hypothetical protein C8R46DRAFT_1035845 [Mycena filopes]|nr:hypothetical protein C8R46DRAFT_1035845 [Mycena filopes]
MSTDIRPDRIVIVLPSDFAHLVDRARPALQRWRSRRRRRGCAAIAPVLPESDLSLEVHIVNERGGLEFREYPDGKEWRARRERGSHRQCVLPVKLPTNKSTPKGKGFATHVHENKDRSTSWSVMRTSRSANAMEVPEESKASDPTDYGWSAHPENADSKTVWWRKAEDHERRPKKEVGKMQSIARDAHGHCWQDAAALPETMPTPVRHRLWHLLEARAVTSRVRSHLLLTSAGVAVTVHEEADNGEGIAVLFGRATRAVTRRGHSHLLLASTGGAVGVHEEADDVEVVRSGIPLRGMVDRSSSPTDRAARTTALEGYGTSDEHSIVTDWGNLTGTGNAEGGAATNGDRPE